MNNFTLHWYEYSIKYDAALYIYIYMLYCDWFSVLLQPHLGKCFGNVKHLAIQILPRQPPTVTAITSAEGEVIDMPRFVNNVY